MMYITRKPFNKLPQRLIYKLPQTVRTGSYYGKTVQATAYRMFDTTTGEYVAQMIADPIEHSSLFKRFYPIDVPYKSFYVYSLKAFERNQGHGSAFLKFAQNESFRTGCKGRVHLIASRFYDRQNPPHVFYRKLGFVSNDKFMNDYLKECAITHVPLENVFMDNLNMYLPIKDDKMIESKQKSKFMAFINFLKRFI
uniref:N-acetyltransferase domain-containing protein n=1 Tax=uncultured Candidatus Melainabacteria bacterium TaxID=2682970 RepID=A0A650F2F1_9BACT|nr:hypothetical protein Melaina855_2120 [uncultured Candidatus Melainabacteria bacterium]